MTIIDAMFFIYVHKNQPATFGGIAAYLLKAILQTDGTDIHFVSDKWVTPSIEGNERTRRAESNIDYQIKGSSQSRPSDWLAALKNMSFKQALIEFLVEN